MIIDNQLLHLVDDSRLVYFYNNDELIDYFLDRINLYDMDILRILTKIVEKNSYKKEKI